MEAQQHTFVCKPGFNSIAAIRMRTGFGLKAINASYILKGIFFKKQEE